MKDQDLLLKIRSKVNEALAKAAKNLKKDENPENISFMCGYKLAMNEVAGWIEMYCS